VELSERGARRQGVGYQSVWRWVMSGQMLGWSKVTAAYPIRTGMDRERTATVHAALIAALGALG
jgi:hypothetical protein